MNTEQLIFLGIVVLSTYVMIGFIRKWWKKTIYYGRREVGATRAFITIVAFVILSLAIKMIEILRTASTANTGVEIFLNIFQPWNMILASMMPMSWLIFLLILKLKDGEKGVVSEIKEDIRRQKISITQSISANYKHNKVEKIQGVSNLFDHARESMKKSEVHNSLGANFILMRKTHGHRQLDISRIRFLNELARKSVTCKQELKISYLPERDKECRKHAINEIRILIDYLKKWECSNDGKGNRGRLSLRECDIPSDDYIITSNNILRASLIDGGYIGYSIDDPQIVDAWRKKYMCDYWKDCSRVRVSCSEMMEILRPIEAGELQYEDQYQKTQDFPPFAESDPDQIIGLDPRDAEAWENENFIVKKSRPNLTSVN